MKILLDTHAFLWFVLGDLKLGNLARSMITDPKNETWISPTCYWEIAIKASTGKYALNVPHELFFETALHVNRFNVLNIIPRHTAIVAKLPFHHRDPFDRLLIAQATHEKMTLISADTIFDAYGVQRMW